MESARTAVDGAVLEFSRQLNCGRMVLQQLDDRRGATLIGGGARRVSPGVPAIRGHKKGRPRMAGTPRFRAKAEFRGGGGASQHISQKGPPRIESSASAAPDSILPPPNARPASPDVGHPQGGTKGRSRGGQHAEAHLRTAAGSADGGGDADLAATLIGGGANVAILGDARRGTVHKGRQGMAGTPRFHTAKECRSGAVWNRGVPAADISEKNSKKGSVDRSLDDDSWSEQSDTQTV